MKKIDLQKTGDYELVQKFEEMVQNDRATWSDDAPIADEWRKVKGLLTVIAGKAFGYQKVKHKDWFAAHKEQLLPLLSLKREAALKHRLSPTQTTRAELAKAKADLQRSARFCANAYWTDLCKSIQTSANAGNLSGVYSGIKQVLGPVIKKTALLKELDGTVITDSVRQLERWVEHYTGIYSQPVDICLEAIQGLAKLDTWTALDDQPTAREFDLAVSQLKRGKSPGSDGIHTELVKLKCMSPVLYRLLCKCWEAGEVPQDMRDANIVTLYKGKGDRGDCNSYCGISLLSIVGKLFSRVILYKLQQLANRIYPESQCGFRGGRSTVDMIFTLRQVQEQCREQNTSLYIAFVDLNKAFDTVSREGLYSALQCIGCPPKLLSLRRLFTRI